MPNKIPLVIRTIVDLKPSQMVSRVFLCIKKMARYLMRPEVQVLLRKHNYHPVNLDLKPMTNSSPNIETVLNGNFQFLNETAVFKSINWSSPQKSRLWRFNLHYCAVVEDFVSKYLLTGDKKYLKAFEEHILSWVGGNEIKIGDGWHPYTISLRITHWILGFSKFPDMFSDSFIDLLTNSLWEQLNFLKGNLEFDIRGNHLLENCKALIIGGLFFNRNGSGKKFFATGLTLLLKQLQEQIHKDGGHFERSPMYHCIALEDLLTIYEAMINNGVEPPPALKPIIEKMLQFLVEILLPNHEIPLLNDSAYEVSLPPQALIEWANSLGFEYDFKVREKSFLKESGYVKISSKNDSTIIFNCGVPRPKFLPGHAHADTLNFIWCLEDGTLVFVDPGVYEYEKGIWRSYFRSTKAHNTLAVDNQNSTEVWGSFRAGRKANIIDSGFETCQKYVHCYGGHDGFKFLPGKPIHRRDLFFFPENILAVVDTISGSRNHCLDSMLHCAPGWDLNMTGDCIEMKKNEYCFRLKCFPIPGCAVSIHSGETDPLLGWYSPEFGLKEPINSVVNHRDGSLPVRTGFICYPASVHVDMISSATELVLKIRDDCYHISLEPGTYPVLTEVT